MRSYLDHAATTALRPEVLDAMLPHLRAGYNPSSLHLEGRETRAALDGARATVARILGVRPREVVFTSGGSEADGLAITGTARAYRGPHRRVVTVATEHYAVLHACEALEGEGWQVVVLPVDQNGRLDPQTFAEALEPGAALASVMLVNNELGTIAPVATLASIARDRGVRFHTDAVQAAGRLAVDAGALGADLVSFTAHKMYGPKGAGVLVVRDGVELAPQMLGGGQEAGRRAGTQNVASIAGFARALELAEAERALEVPRLTALRELMERGLLARVPDCRINGAAAARAAHISNVTFAGVDTAELLVRLDLSGIAASAGSACSAGAVEASHVMRALYGAGAHEGGTVRLSLGMRSTETDVERVLSVVPEAVASLRGATSNVGTGFPARSNTCRSEVFS